MTAKNFNTSRATLALIRPRITEKAAIQAEKGMYSFEVSSTATKPEIRAAVKDMYKVTPIRVNILAANKKNIVRRGRKGVKSSNKKAVVLLKKGEKIDFI